MIGRGPGRISLRGRGPGRIVSSGAGRTPQRPDLGNPGPEVPGLELPEASERGLGGVRPGFPGESGVGAQAAEAEPSPARSATSPGTPSLLLDNTPPHPGLRPPNHPLFVQPQVLWTHSYGSPSSSGSLGPQASLPEPARSYPAPGLRPRSAAFAPRSARLVMRRSPRSFRSPLWDHHAPGLQTGGATLSLPHPPHRQFPAHCRGTGLRDEGQARLPSSQGGGGGPRST